MQLVGDAIAIVTCRYSVCTRQIRRLWRSCWGSGQGNRFVGTSTFGPPTLEAFGVLPARARILVGDFDRLDVCRIWNIGQVGPSANPLNDTVTAVCVATIPDPQMEPRWSLRILVVTSELLLVVFLANLLSVNGPDKTVRRPVENVGMEFVGRIVDSGLSASVVVARDTFAKHVGLYFTYRGSEIASAPLPVDLIQAVRHQHSASNDTSAFRSFGDDFDSAKKEIETCPYVRSIKTFSECEVRAIGPVFDSRLICEGPI